MRRCVARPALALEQALQDDDVDDEVIRRAVAVRAQHAAHRPVVRRRLLELHHGDRAARVGDRVDLGVEHDLLAGLVSRRRPNAFGTVAATTPEEGRAVARRYHDAGFHQVKLYSLLEPDVVSSIAGEAHRLGVTVTGHVPTAMTLQQAVAAGMDHIAHLAVRDEPGSEELRRTSEFLRSTERYSMRRSPGGASRALDVDSDRLVSAGVSQIPAPLRRLFDSAGTADLEPAAARARLERGLRIVGRASPRGSPDRRRHRRGDSRAPPPPEIELYAEAGLTPLEAIQAATIVPARAMRLEKELGTIEAGKHADLVVLDANPLERISNIRTVRFVVTDGRMYDAAELWRSVRFSP